MLKIENIYSSELLTRELPINFIQKDFEYFEKEITKKIPKNQIYTIQNVKIFNNYLIKFRFYNLVLNLSLFQKNEIIRKIKILLKYLLRKSDPIRIDKGCFVTDNKSFNYFHWYLDSVPRLIEIKEKFPDIILLLPKKISDQLFVQQFCSAFDIDFIELHENKTYKVDTLVTVNKIAPTGNFRKKNLEKIISLFSNLNIDKESKSKRIWISRQNSLTKIENFIELTKLLKNFDIDVINLEDLDLREQVKLFKSIEFVGGLHGAGFTNLIHSNDTKVLEVRNDSNKSRNCYFSLCSDLGLDYYYFLSSKFKKNNNGSFTTVLDLNHLESTLKEMFIDT